MLVQTGLARPLRRVGVNSLAQVATLILVAVGSELLVKRFLWAGGNTCLGRTWATRRLGNTLEKNE